MHQVFEYFHWLLHDYTVRTITLGTTVMGIVWGMLGSFAVLRKQSLLGDAISHAALPGIALVFLIIGGKDPWWLFLGAVVSGLIGTIWIMGITSKTRLKSDTALGIILSVFFGFGMLLLTIIQKQPNANQAGLDDFLFGQAATLMVKDVWLVSIVGTVSLAILFLFWKEFKILTFDGQYAKTLGFNIKFLDILLTMLIVIAIVIGLQTVGVVLMSAMLLAPAAAARQWTNKLGSMVILASVFGASSGILGTAISTSVARIATGPVIVIVAVVIVVFSFVFAPERGLLSRRIRQYQNRKNLRLNKILSFMYEIVSSHENFKHPHSYRILSNFQNINKKYLKELEDKNLIILEGENWILTQEGYEKAKEAYKK